MKKKWSCSECDYESGRRWNVTRHIANMHYKGSPEISTRYAFKTDPNYYAVNFFSNSYGSNSTEMFKRERASKIFADSYQFANPIYRILMQFKQAMNLEEGFEKQLIMTDLVNQYERAKRPEVAFSKVHLFPPENFFAADQNSTVGHPPPTNSHIPERTNSMNNHTLVGDPRLRNRCR
jgi:hypothetical protein